MNSSTIYKTFFKEDEEIPDEFWGNEGAGALFVAKDTGRLLLFLRSDMVQEPGTWNLVGGKIDTGENPKEAVAREVSEETGYDGEYKMSLLYTFQHRDFKYHNFLVVVPFEFTPQLNWEHDNSLWVEYGDWPEPLHFGLNDLIKHAGHKIKRVIELINQKRARVTEVDAPPAHIQPATQQPTNTINLTNSYIVAATLWGEARGEGEIGMQAVMNVIMNRAKGDFSKASKIVLKPKQFSMWNKIPDPEASALNLAREIRRTKPQDEASYMKAIEIVDKAATGKLPDITDGATFYVSPKKASPDWAKKMIKTKTIGNHDFYKKPSKISEGITQEPMGLEDVDTYLYRMKSDHSILRYSHDRNTNTFHLRHIGTPNVRDQDKGYATELLGAFFQLIKAKKGILDPGPYTGSGTAYIKHVVERLANQYNIRLVYDKT